MPLSRIFLIYYSFSSLSYSKEISGSTCKRHHNAIACNIAIQNIDWKYLVGYVPKAIHAEYVCKYFQQVGQTSEWQSRKAQILVDHQEGSQEMW